MAKETGISQTRLIATTPEYDSGVMVIEFFLLSVGDRVRGRCPMLQLFCVGPTEQEVYDSLKRQALQAVAAYVNIPERIEFRMSHKQGTP
jgi:hypothetical protein